MADDMSCRAVIHLICWYLEGKLTPSVAQEVDDHVKSCPDCHIVFHAATMTLDAYFSADEPSAMAPSAPILSARQHSRAAND